MKRIEEINRVIKVAGSQDGSLGLSPVVVATPATVFPQHNRTIMEQISVAQIGSTNFQRVVPGSGISVFRETCNNVSSQPPPIAHATLIPQASVPASIITGIKPETITLPNTPLNVHYASSSYISPIVPPTSCPPVSSSNIVSHASSFKTNHMSQIINPKSGTQSVATYGPPTGIRAVTTVSSGGISNSSGVSGMGNTMGPVYGTGSQQFQRLKVEDALSYLDQVKFKFGNQPKVYNDFLDIMKEFKSQSIDTPGVIQRVSCLFKGNPELIVGFNTFLPPGYKIEIQCNEAIAINMPGVLGAGMQTIVHTPQGIHTMGAHGLVSIVTTSSPSSVVASGVQNNLVGQTGALSSVPRGHHSTSGIPGQSHNQQLATLSLVSGVAKYNATNKAASETPHSYPVTIIVPPSAAGASSVGNSQPQYNNVGHLHDDKREDTNVSSQPVEFNHAISYVNKIKLRFQGQPDVYKQFLEILHSYQRDQKAATASNKESSFLPPAERQLTEGEVFSQVSRLFHQQEDLLSEFSLFLPESTSESANNTSSNNVAVDTAPSANTKLSDDIERKHVTYGSGGVKYGGIKRPPSGLTQQPNPKKAKYGVLRDISLAEAGKYSTLNEYAFFDKVRKALHDPQTYDNFLRCLVLFNQEVISRSDLILLVTPFLCKHVELFKWFKEFTGYKETGEMVISNQPKNNILLNTIGGGATSRERISGDAAMEIDYSTCKRLGASYCALPKKFVQPGCTGRSPLCMEVLNDTWVSFPSWSEDSTFVSSRKTQYEEFIYRTEDERFEFDVILETNKDTIKVLECVQKKMNRLAPEEAARYRLDDCLGGTSPTIHQRAINRIYGDKASDVIEGLKRNPVVAVPLVLRRLRSKDEEWREVQKNFNKVWREQNEKYYLKSLDHQGLLFKQGDVRNLRSKSLLNEIETLYDERHEAEENGASIIPTGPHLTLEYSRDPSILDDANNLLIHHVKRQTSIHKEDKARIKVLLRHTLLDMFRHARQDLSDDDEENPDSVTSENVDAEEVNKGGGVGSAGTRITRKTDAVDREKVVVPSPSELRVKQEPKCERKTPPHAKDYDADECYTHIICNNNWYLFLRLHQILCERLSKMYNLAASIACEDAQGKKERKESTALALRLKPKNEIEPEEYYPTFIDMVKNVLDGNMDIQTYEDTLREMFGIHAYIAFTLDKVVCNTFRQLQYLVTDESSIECLDIFLAESKKFATGGTCGGSNDRYMAELMYQRRAEKVLADENCIKTIIYQQAGRITFEMIDTESGDASGNSDHDQDELVDCPEQKWHSYVERFIRPGDTLSEECRKHLIQKPVFLPRGIRTYKESAFADKLMRATNWNRLGAGSTNHVDDTVTKIKQEEEEQTPGFAKEFFVGNSTALPNRNRNIIARPVFYDDNTQCNFSTKHLKILYVINTENCFYRKEALLRAKKTHRLVCLRKSRGLERWHSVWLDRHTTQEQINYVSQWFLGNIDGLVPCTTRCVTRNDHFRPPYRTLNKFKTEFNNKIMATADVIQQFSSHS